MVCLLHDASTAYCNSVSTKHAWPAAAATVPQPYVRLRRRAVSRDLGETRTVGRTAAGQTMNARTTHSCAASGGQTVAAAPRPIRSRPGVAGSQQQQQRGFNSHPSGGWPGSPSIAIKRSITPHQKSHPCARGVPAGRRGLRSPRPIEPAGRPARVAIGAAIPHRAAGGQRPPEVAIRPHRTGTAAATPAQRAFAAGSRY
jgi:hypothetical protein